RPGPIRSASDSGRMMACLSTTLRTISSSSTVLNVPFNASNAFRLEKRSSRLSMIHRTTRRSTHLVNDVDLYPGKIAPRHVGRSGSAFLLAERGRLTLPVWVDHVGSAETRHVTGDLHPNWPIDRQPDVQQMPRIEPPEKG